MRNNVFGSPSGSPCCPRVAFVPRPCRRCPWRVSGASGLLRMYQVQNVPDCIRLYQNLPHRTKLNQIGLVFGMTQIAPDCTTLYQIGVWSVPGCTRVYPIVHSNKFYQIGVQSVPDCTRLKQIVPDCTKTP